jgi:outer membrane protein OmpA-like peptidoglycan-associated protein
MNSILARFTRKISATAAVALLTLLGVLAVHPLYAQQVAKENTGTVTEPLGDSYEQPTKLAPDTVRVTFYRPATGYASGVSRLQINDHYHTSLQHGSYSEICLPPGRISLASRMVKTGNPLKDNNDATAGLPIKAGQNVFIRLNESGDNRATITPVAAKVALAELKDTRRQNHAVSRVPNTVDCFPPAPRVLKQENITLGADALFAFGKSDINDISPAGRTSLDELVARLQKDYGTQDNVQIQIEGHADPLGNPASNKRLATARAQAIRTYMVNGGLNPKTITATGIGSAQPVITTCGKTATPQTIACNKPNRRVVVGVQALAR